MSITRRAPLGAAAAIVALGAAGPATAAPVAKVVPVKITDFAFGGKQNLKLSLKVGDVLRFTWAGQQAHDVDLRRAPNGVKKVHAALAVRRAPLVVKLTKAGTYRFVCTPHEMLGMTATVTVR